MRLNQSQIPGRSDRAITARVRQKAALSGRSASRSTAPKTLSSARVSIPAEKHQLATDRRFLHGATTAKPALNAAAAKASK